MYFQCNTYNYEGNFVECRQDQSGVLSHSVQYRGARGYMHFITGV